ncbi:MAG TPA: septum formation initiator family protein [Chitinophagaceae bacterium]|nr:septum formation initiator family protein [Chitinophagaceae bacterium]
MEDRSNNRPSFRSGLLKLPGLLRNKYFVSFGVFAAIMLFFDKNDLFTQSARNRQLRDLQESKQYYLDRISSERKELEQLKSNPGTLEKYAREKYLMKRDNEDLFIIPEAPETE